MWWHDLKEQLGERVDKDNVIVQEMWSDADAYDRQIAGVWDEAGDNSV